MNDTASDDLFTGRNVHTILDIISSIFLALAIILNSLGIYLLYLQEEKKWSHQKIMLTALSISLIAISTSEGIYLIGEWSGLEEETSVFLKYCDIVTAGLFFTYYTVLFTLTIMRLLSCVYIFNYHKIISCKSLVCVLASFWILGLVAASPFIFMSTQTFVDIWYKWIYLSLDSLILVSVTFTYTFIARTSYKSKRAAKGAYTAYSNIQYVKVTLLIVITFILLVVTPDVYFAYRFAFTKTGTVMEERAVMACWQLNYIIEPLIYIFFQKEIRRTLYRMLANMVCAKEELYEIPKSNTTTFVVDHTKKKVVDDTHE